MCLAIQGNFGDLLLQLNNSLIVNCCVIIVTQVYCLLVSYTAGPLVEVLCNWSELGFCRYFVCTVSSLSSWLETFLLNSQPQTIGFTKHWLQAKTFFPNSAADYLNTCIYPPTASGPWLAKPTRVMLWAWWCCRHWISLNLRKQWSLYPAHHAYLDIHRCLK